MTHDAFSDRDYVQISYKRIICKRKKNPVRKTAKYNKVPPSLNGFLCTVSDLRIHYLWEVGHHC